MATIKLSDGREIPIIKPHLGDQMDLERQMRATNPNYGPHQFRDDMNLGSFQTAFSIFASLKRAGIPTTITEVLELDLGELTLTLEPGDDPDQFSEGEGEQSADPQPAPTGDVAAA